MGKMFGYFLYRRADYLAHYHKRSNVESTFSMIKRKFGDFVRSKTDVAMVNEVLAKVLCHNLVVLIHESFELEISPILRQKPRLPQKSPRRAVFEATSGVDIDLALKEGRLSGTGLGVTGSRVTYESAQDGR